jgi:hypothetical protein
MIRLRSVGGEAVGAATGWPGGEVSCPHAATLVSRTRATAADAFRFDMTIGPTIQLPNVTRQIRQSGITVAPKRS